MRIVKSTPEERERIARRLGELLENGALLIPVITKTSSQTFGYRYKVSLAYNGEDGRGVDVMYLNYWLASELKQNLTDDDELKGNGIGFDRFHDVAYTIAEILRKRYGFAFSLQNLPKFVRGN